MAALAQHDDDEQLTETTPLMPHRPTVNSQNLPSLSLPSLSPVVNHVRLHGIQTVDGDPSLFALVHSASLAQQTSFKIVVLSQLYILTKVPQTNVDADVWEQWARERRPSLDAEDLQQRIVNVWEEFLEVSRSTREIEECLWSPFAQEEGKPLTVCVADILKGPDAPPALLSHRLIILSLSHTWTRGRVVISAGSSFRRILQRFRSVATPRIVHAVDILLQLVYFALLSDYAIHPPERPIVTSSLKLIGAREALLMIHSTASLLRPPTLSLVPFSFVAGAFLFTLPSVPFPGDTSYSILLGALSLHMLLLHLPRTPSPIFLLSPDVTLPIATLIWHEFSRTLYPCIIFFLPATILASFFLSIALEDSIPRFPTMLTLVEPTPMEIRVAFSFLWTILILLMIFSAVLLVLFSGSSLSSRPVGSWDRYSVAVGLRSRGVFAAAVATYSVPYYFPPPFNLPQIAFVHIPQIFMQCFGWKASPVTEQIERVLWYSTTGPLAFVLVVCWFLFIYPISSAIRASVAITNYILCYHLSERNSVLSTSVT